VNTRSTWCTGLFAVAVATFVIFGLIETVPVAQSGPTYEGFGAVTRGHLDCPGGNWTTYRVTNLNDSGAGSFRSGLSSGCRHIVFDVGGTIPVNSDITINQDYLTIDGSTAPSPGITLRTATNNEWIMILGNSGAGSDGVHDIIIRDLRAIGPGGHDNTSSDLFGLDGGNNPVYNIIIDHMTLVASNDGTLDIWGNVHDVTLSWNFIKDTRTAAVFSSDDLRQRISVHHNVFAGNNERQIKTNHRNEVIDYVNNVVYGWGWMVPTGTGLDLDAQGYTSTHPTANVMNNYFHHVSGLNGGTDQAILRNGSGGRVYFSGNIVPSGESDTNSTSSYHSIPANAQVTTYAASTLGNTTVPCVGMKYKTSEEQSLLNTISRAIGGSGAACSGSTPPTSAPAAPTNVRIIR
jgi:pectate lyase